MCAQYYLYVGTVCIHSMYVYIVHTVHVFPTHTHFKSKLKAKLKAKLEATIQYSCLLSSSLRSSCLSAPGTSGGGCLIYVRTCMYVCTMYAITLTLTHICTYYLSLHLLAVPSVAPQIPTHTKHTHTHSRSGSSMGVRGNGITWYLAANSSSSDFSAAASANCCSTVSTNV